MPWLAAIGALAGSTVGSVLQSESERKARSQQQGQFNANLEFQRQLRGEGGYPTTFSWSPMGRKAEETSFSKALDLFNTMQRPTSEMQKQYSDLASKYTPYMGQGVENVMSGNYLQTMLANEAPAAAARLAQAKGLGASWAPTLASRISAIEAQNRLQGRGQAGQSNQMAMADTELAMRQQVQDAVLSALTKNAETEKVIRDEEIARQLGLQLQAPQLAQGMMQMYQLPQTGMSQEFLSSMNALSPYMVKPAYTTLPYTQYVSPTSTGGALASSLGGGMQGLSNYLAQQQYMNQLKDMMASYGGTGTSSSSPYSGPIGYAPTYNPSEGDISW